MQSPTVYLKITKYREKLPENHQKSIFSALGLYITLKNLFSGQFNIG